VTETASTPSPGGLAPLPQIGWFSALCDDDHVQLGVPEPALLSSWDHCADIVREAERCGFDNVLLPSGYSLGIDATAFAAAVATHTSTIGLLLAVRCGELHVAQLARQLATIDQLSRGRLAVNIISSEMPGEQLAAGPRYRRTLEVMSALRTLLAGQGLDLDGEFVRLHVDPPRICAPGGTCPPLYFGGLSDDAREVAAAAADVYLMWPDTLGAVAEVVADVRARAARYGRRLRVGYRVHVIVRETEAEARRAADWLMQAVDEAEGRRIRARSLDSTSVGVRRQTELRDAADAEGFVEDHLWTGIGRARSGCGAAIVGDPDQVAAKLRAYRELGIDAFILSGYPHLDECTRVAQLVLGRTTHGPLGLAH
jgi:alkanesulfonate monooxygenase